MSSKEDAMRYDYWKRNTIALVFDGLFFMTASAFSDVSVISPFILRATGSTLLVGLHQMISTIGFFIPQILSVNIGELRYKKNIVLKWTLIGRCCLIFAVLITLLTNSIQLIVVSFFISLGLYHFFDGFGMIPWLELIAKTIPPSRRGNFFGLYQSLGGLGSIVGGFVISWMLSNQVYVFPRNYGILILIQLMILLCGATFLLLLKEKPDEVSEEKKKLIKSIREIPELIRKDFNVRVLAVSIVSISFYSMVLPFYSIYALSTLDIEEGFLGIFLAAQMTGRLISSFIWAQLCNKGYNKEIIQYSSLLFLLSPILVLMVGMIPFPQVLVKYIVALVFLLLGTSMNGLFLGVNNYIMGIEDKTRRPLFLSFFNFLNIITSVLPLIGGIIANYSSYESVFLLSLPPLAIGMVLLHSLKHKI